MNGLVVFLVGVLFVAYALVASRLSTTVVTGPMFFVAAGFLMGSGGFRLVGVDIHAQLITVLFEATLAVVLFGDAAAINSSNWRHDASLPGRLLGIGLPLTILAGLVTALILLGDLDIWEAGVLAAILAPTDAALGQAVISNPRVPRRLRRALNVESGLNDGIAIPLVLFFLIFAEEATTHRPFATLLSLVGREILVAAVVGLILGWVGGKLLVAATRRGSTGGIWPQIGAVALAAAAYGLADQLGGSGFIAVWLAGLFLGSETRGNVEGAGLFAETLGAGLTMLSFFVFGAIVLVSTIHDVTWQIVVYAVASLTVIRLLPVAASLIGTGLRGPSVVFLGWFGPRGLASIVITGLAVEATQVPHRDLLVTTAMLTVAISVVAHGITAWWGSERFADWWEAHPPEAPPPARRPSVSVPRRFQAPGLHETPEERSTLSSTPEEHPR